MKPKRRNLCARRTRPLAAMRASAPSTPSSAYDCRRRVATRALPPVAIAAVSGGIAACASHSLSVPLDVIKTRVQTETFDDERTASVAAAIVQREGVLALLSGWEPTFVGYGVQGAIKYGGTDALRRLAAASATTSGVDGTGILTVAACAASAELVASAFLTPMEQVRIRSVSREEYRGKSFGEALAMFREERGFETTAANLPVIYSKMIPYTAVQLASYDALTRAFAEHGLAATQTRPLAALLAGVLASLASQPGDTLLSNMNKGSSASEETGVASKTPRDPIAIAIELGPGGLFTGWRQRLLHTGSIVFTQLLAYDFAKDLLGHH